MNYTPNGLFSPITLEIRVGFQILVLQSLKERSCLELIVFFFFFHITLRIK